MQSRAYPQWKIRVLLFNSDNAPSENFRTKSVSYSLGYSHSDLMALDVSILSPRDYQAFFGLRRGNIGSFQHFRFLFSAFFVFVLTQFSKTVSFGMFCSVGTTSGQRLAAASSCSR